MGEFLDYAKANQHSGNCTRAEAFTMGQRSRQSEIDQIKAENLRLSGLLKEQKRCFDDCSQMVSDLIKERDQLKAELQASLWGREAGFKLFFKARDMSGGWHGFERKPEFHKLGGYWFGGGKSKYIHGDEWCDEETAINSLQALRGEHE